MHMHLCSPMRRKISHDTNLHLICTGRVITGSWLHISRLFSLTFLALYMPPQLPMLSFLGPLCKFPDFSLKEFTFTILVIHFLNVWSTSSLISFDF